MSVVIRQSDRSGLAAYGLARFYTRHESSILKLAGIAVALALWQLAVNCGLANPMVVSSPLRIAVAGAAYMVSHQFAVDAATSGVEFLGGFALALLFGTIIGFATGCSKRVEWFLDPLINFCYASPRIALTPLLIIWFGIGIQSKVAIIFLMSVFPVIINTALGVRSVDKDLADLARSLNASRWQLLWTIMVPSSIPFVVTGVRIALGLAMIGVVVGEFSASTAGIGFTIQQAASSYEVDLVFVGLFIIGTAGALLTEGLRYIEDRLAAWKGQP